MKLVSWCFNQTNPKDPKYETLTYQLYVSITFLIIATSFGFWFTDYYEAMFPQVRGSFSDRMRFIIGGFMILYWLILMISRLVCSG